MKAKVKLNYSVELFVEAENEDQLHDWLLVTTPDEAKDLAIEAGKMVDEHYSEEIICEVSDDGEADISITTY